jgi:hypothetical protein
MRGIRVTSVARTICDLAATEPAREVEVVFQEALYRDVVSERQVRAVLDREPHRRGAPEIRDLLRDPRMTRSEKERALLRLIDAAQLPRPLTNVRVHGYLVDAFWPKEGLVVEVDGWDAHGHRVAFESTAGATRCCSRTGGGSCARPDASSSANRWRWRLASPRHSQRPDPAAIIVMCRQ